jgi:FKBP-type peptidyl-prolyl cis-trans isomerase FklB
MKEDCRMKHPVISLLGIALLATTCWGAAEIALTTDQDKTNYSVGYQIGGDFKRQGLELKPEALVKGIEDALAGSKPLLTEEEMHATLINLKKKILAEEEAKRAQATKQLREEGQAFLEANAKKEGVVVLPSGLQYKVIKAGTGKQPTLEDSIKVNYRGTRINGKEFGSSYRQGKPDVIALKKTIPGWQEALPLMKEGAKWELYLPSHLAFDERGPLEGVAVIYEVELVAVEPAAPQEQSEKTPDQKQ